MKSKAYVFTFDEYEEAELQEACKRLWDGKTMSRFICRLVVIGLGNSVKIKDPEAFYQFFLGFNIAMHERQRRKERGEPEPTPLQTKAAQAPDAKLINTETGFFRGVPREGNVLFPRWGKAL